MSNAIRMWRGASAGWLQVCCHSRLLQHTAGSKILFECFLKLYMCIYFVVIIFAVFTVFAVVTVCLAYQVFDASIAPESIATQWQVAGAGVVEKGEWGAPPKVRMACTTPKPTAAPTKPPTTGFPTAAPTSFPTPPPSPSVAPTRMPTQQPTLAPTPTPTVNGCRSVVLQVGTRKHLFVSLLIYMLSKKDERSTPSPFFHLPRACVFFALAHQKICVCSLQGLPVHSLRFGCMGTYVRLNKFYANRHVYLSTRSHNDDDEALPRFLYHYTVSWYYNTVQVTVLWYAVRDAMITEDALQATLVKASLS